MKIIFPTTHSQWSKVKQTLSRDFKFSRRRVWCSELSSGLYCHVKWLSADVSEVSTASITHPWWWRLYALLKRRSTIILHGSISQKKTLNINPEFSTYTSQGKEHISMTRSGSKPAILEVQCSGPRDHYARYLIQQSPWIRLFSETTWKVKYNIITEQWKIVLYKEIKL
jgi:hypothetical protein